MVPCMLPYARTTDPPTARPRPPSPPPTIRAKLPTNLPDAPHAYTARLMYSSDTPAKMHGTMPALELVYQPHQRHLIPYALKCNRAKCGRFLPFTERPTPYN